jgi:tripartite-type tricarboxylate transporter receptor subunit TctC
VSFDQIEKLQKRRMVMRVSAIVASFLLALGLSHIQGNARAASASEVEFYPERRVHVILASGPGFSPDVIARLLGAKLTESWGRPIVIDNRPGATALIAVEMLANAAPDGCTLGMFTMTNLIAMLMYQKYMLATERGALTLVDTTPFAIGVNASTPVKNIAEWIAYAKAWPGQLRYASSGRWGSSHLCMENFNDLTGLKMTHVP